MRYEFLNGFDQITIPERTPIASAVEELLLIWLASEPDEWIDRICHLPL
jgi:hypothetical protein